MRRPLVALLAASFLLAAACSDGGDAAPTTMPPTTVRATTTTVRATTTTDAATTTSVELPQPLPPPDARAREPYTMLGTIEIPAIKVKKKLLEGVSLNTLDRGPGHWPGTAMPGQIGNVVIGGHRTSHDRPFRHIDKLVPGDEVILTTLEGRYVYTVRETRIVTPDALWVVDQKPAYTAVLFACHPVGSTSHRLVVFLELQET